MRRGVCNRNKQAQVALFIVIGLIIVIFAGILFYYESLYAGTEPRAVQLELCKGDVAFNSCSYDKPMFCTYDPDTEDLVLVEDCSRCSCSQGMACTGSKCEEIDNEQHFPFKIFFVPLNYEPDDPRFVSRVKDIKSEFRTKLGLPNNVFVIVDEQLETDAVCDTDLGAISLFVEDWYKSKNKKFFPAPINNRYSYSIIAIDKLLQDITKCGCGFTYLYGDAIYLGGEECSHYLNVADHELGHTFGLCDEYDTCIWEATNELSKCRNTKPGLLDSDCGHECCTLDRACCRGKYSELGFNVMGSADLPYERDFNLESISVITKDLCQNFNICEVEE